MQAQNTGGSIVSITASLADNPVAGIPASVSMMTKGGLNAALRSLAYEYAKEEIRFNAVAPGVVDTPLHSDISEQIVKAVTDAVRFDGGRCADAVVYLTEARHVTGEVLHVDDGAHVENGSRKGSAGHRRAPTAGTWD